MSIPDTPSLTPEAEFAWRRDRSERKALGQFFTPDALADLMADWVLQNRPKAVLDPAVGPGALLAACQRRDSAISLVGCDIDELAIDISCRRFPNRYTARLQNYLESPFTGTFDGIICNPPYIRHHTFELDESARQRIMLRSGVKAARTANAYIFFILRICSELAPGGRASILVPAEWTNANYGDAIKRYFAERGTLRQVVYFSADGLPFDDNLSTACLLNIENSAFKSDVDTLYVKRFGGETSLEALRESVFVIQRRVEITDLANSRKWNDLLLNGVREEIAGYTKLGSLASTKRGIATGDNGYFLLSLEEAAKRNLRKSDLKICVGKANHAKQELFGFEDVTSLKASDARIYLFDPALPLDDSSKNYIRAGEAAETHKRYLCRSRSPWYRAEARSPAPIWAGVFGRGRIRFVYNAARAHNLTCFHGIYPSVGDDIFARALTVCLNSDPVMERARQQHRVYGGGLLKVEPKDLLDMEVPDLTKVDAALLAALSASLDQTASVDARTALVVEAAEQAAAKPGRLL